jgi:hypothetical protein
MNWHGGRFECNEHKFDIAVIDKIADLPERGKADSKPLGHGGVGARRIVRSEPPVYPHSRRLAVDENGPGIVLSIRTSDHALMMRQLMGMLGPSVLVEILWGAEENPA